HSGNLPPFFASPRPFVSLRLPKFELVRFPRVSASPRLPPSSPSELSPVSSSRLSPSRVRVFLSPLPLLPPIQLGIIGLLCGFPRPSGTQLKSHNYAICKP